MISVTKLLSSFWLKQQSPVRVVAAKQGSECWLSGPPVGRASGDARVQARSIIALHAFLLQATAAASTDSEGLVGPLTAAPMHAGAH
jgi:hypothetical protein